jgi:hypothetical protein
VTIGVLVLLGMNCKLYQPFALVGFPTSFTIPHNIVMCNLNYLILKKKQLRWPFIFFTCISSDKSTVFFCKY